jgi:hypothetical protein
MTRAKQILVRDDSGKQQVVLEFPSLRAGQPLPYYELPNRSKVERMSDSEFVVVQTGQVLTRTTTARS